MMNTLIQKLQPSTHRIFQWLLQYRLASSISCVSYRNDCNIYDYHLPIWIFMARNSLWRTSKYLSISEIVHSAELLYQINFIASRQFNFAALIELLFIMTTPELNYIYNSSRVIFYVSKFLGLSAYQFERKTLRFRTTFWNYIELVLTVSSWLVMNYLQFSRRSQSLGSGIQSKFLDQLWRYQYMLQYFSIPFVVIYSFCKRKHVEDFLKFILDFDQSVSRLGWKFKVSHSPVVSSILALAPLVVLIAEECYFVFIADVFVNQYPWVHMILYGIVTEFFAMLSIQFIMSCYCIYSRLNAFTKNIR